jgi:hypothetical protein
MTIAGCVVERLVDLNHDVSFLSRSLLRATPQYSLLWQYLGTATGSAHPDAGIVTEARFSQVAPTITRVELRVGWDVHQTRDCSQLLWEATSACAGVTK